MTVVVEQVKPGSTAEQAGLRRGDRLVSFVGKPLTSPAMLQALEENTPGVECVALRGERDGQPWHWSLPPGKRGAEVRPERPDIKVRPELPDALLDEYERGRKAYQAKNYLEAIRLWGAVAPRVPEGIGSAWVYQQVNWAAHWVSEFQAGRNALTVAHDLQCEGTDPAAQVRVWIGLSGCCIGMSDLDAAHGWTEMARQADAAMGWLRWLAQDNSRLGLIAQYRGDLRAAKEYYSQACSICEGFDSDDQYLAMLLNNLGNIALMQGDLATARSHFADGHGIWERHSPGTIYEAVGCNNLGRIASRLGDFSTAMDLHTRALRINEQVDSGSHEMGDSLNYVGSTAMTQGDLPSARECFTRALGIWQKRGTYPGYLAKAHENLGQVASRQGDLEAAADRHLQALRIRETVARQSPHVARSLTALGGISLGRNDPDAAEDCFQRALTIYEGIAPGSMENASCLEGMGRVDVARNRPAEAVPRFRRAVEIVERFRTQIAAPEDRALMLAQHLHKYAGLVGSLLAVGQVGEAFHTLERARARSFLELLAGCAMDTTDAPPTLLQGQRDIDRQRAQAYDRLSRLTGTDEDQDAIEELHRTLRDLERRQQEFVTQIRAASPHYASLQYPQPLELAEAQAALEPGTLLLSYLVDEEQTLLFAVTATSAEAYTLPLSRVALWERVRSFRQALDRNRLTHDAAQETALGRSLYAQLARPAHALIRRAERLMLCPDGPLHTLPFAALVTNTQGKPRYLGAEKAMHSILSATTHAQARASRPKPGQGPMAPPRLLAFGDPLYGASEGKDQGTGDAELSLLQTRGLSLAPLPHSRAEVEGLARLFGDDATVRLGAEATKTAVLREGGDADLLHFACHGWFDPHLPLSSGLVLSRPQTAEAEAADGDNGLLQAWEIFQMRLSADLVVLSSCQSGLGQEVRGEGLLGLTRAFQYAGARSLVATLWDVNDASTSLFMQAFYTQIKTGAGKDDALRRGVRALQADPRWDAPCHWAAFVLIGDRQ